VKRVTGRSVGANVGGFVGSAFGSPTIGAAVGDTLSTGLSNISDQAFNERGQATAQSQAPAPTAVEVQGSGQDQFATTFNYGIQPAVLRSGDFGMQGQMMNPNVQQAFLKPTLQLGLAAGAGLIDLFFQDPITGEVKRKRITRKFKSEVKQAVALLGIEAVAAMLETSEEVIVQILLKRFRNDGPYITKAAVRKTRTTVRKMERVNELSKEIGKLAGATTRRRATTSRAGSSSTRKTIAIN
jgi:hypothetical protein